MWQSKPYEKREDPGDEVGDEVSVFILSILIQMNTSIWVMTFKKICKMKSWKALKNKTLPLGSQLLKFTMRQTEMANYIWK